MHARRRQTQLTRISLDANKRVLEVGPFKGRMVGSLTTEVLEDQKLVLGELRARFPEGPSRVPVDGDLKAIGEELQRRWHAFTA